MTNPETAALRAVLTVTVETRPDGGHYFDQADFAAHVAEWVRSALRGKHAVDQVTVAEAAAVSVPPPAPRADDRAALRDHIAEAFARYDWNVAPVFRNVTPNADHYGLADAVLAELPAPADWAAVLREAAEALGRMDYDTDSHDYGYDTYRDAWNGGVMDGADLLRRLADEAAVVPPPALTEAGRLRMQVEVLQKDAERDRGLAKVGARCMRDGHQGLIEQGRLVLEGWRFALSTALDLGTGAPWEAIHERVKELHSAAAVSGPCVAGEQQNETPEGKPGCAHCGGDHSWDDCEAYTALVSEEQPPTDKEPEPGDRVRVTYEGTWLADDDPRTLLVGNHSGDIWRNIAPDHARVEVLPAVEASE